jgi:Cu/Zn superoxide dismutase
MEEVSSIAAATVVMKHVVRTGRFQQRRPTKKKQATIVLAANDDSRSRRMWQGGGGGERSPCGRSINDER